WPWRSSSAPTRPRASSCSTAAGSWNAASPGWPSSAASYATTRPPSHPRSHDLDRRHLAAQQPPHPLTQFTDALSEEVVGDLAGDLLRVVAQLGWQVVVEPQGGQPMNQGPGG